jgi:hypothetical protein
MRGRRRNRGWVGRSDGQEKWEERSDEPVFRWPRD